MNKRILSRHLPPAPAPAAALITLVGWLGIIGLAIWFLAVLYSNPIATVSVLFVLVIAYQMMSRWDTRRRLALAATRPGNPLCTFARAVNLRTVDPWMVRATFEELQPYFPKQAQPFPIRPADKIVDDLSIDPEEVDYIAHAIAVRAGYSLESTEHNPLHGKVETVGELIQYFTHQPRVTTRPRVSASREA